jgi:HEAT repeat protein
MTMKQLIYLILAALIAGCAPTQKGQPVFAPAPAPQPPLPPPKKNVSLDPALHEEARKELFAAAESNDPVIRANAIEAMQDTLGEQATDTIVKDLDDPEPVVRFAAAMAAGKLKLHAAYSRLEQMADDHDVNIRVAVRFALHGLGDTRRSHDFETYARYPDKSVRGNVAMALGLLGEPTALRVLRPMTSDRDATVRLQAAEAMWRLGDQDGLDTLVVGTVSEYPDDQIICLLALAQPRDSRVAGHLRSKLTAEAPEVALAAARAMGMIGSDLGYVIAQKGAKSVDARQKVLAALAFGQIGRPDAQPILAPMLKDANESVRLAAATAVLQLKS